MALSHEVLATESGGEAVTPPSRKTTFTRAAGAVLVAAVLGATVLVAGGYASGRHVGISAGSNPFTYLQAKYMSKECVTALTKMEKEGTTSHEVGHDIKCEAEHKACKITMAWESRRRRVYKSVDMSVCFPSHECKTANLKSELAAGMGSSVAVTLFQCAGEKPLYAEIGANGKPDCAAICKNKYQDTYREITAVIKGSAPFCGSSADSCRRLSEEKFTLSSSAEYDGGGTSAEYGSEKKYTSAWDRVVYSGKSDSCFTQGSCCRTGQKVCCCMLTKGYES